MVIAFLTRTVLEPRKGMHVECGNRNLMKHSVLRGSIFLPPLADTISIYQKLFFGLPQRHDGKRKATRYIYIYMCNFSFSCSCFVSRVEAMKYMRLFYNHIEISAAKNM